MISEGAVLSPLRLPVRKASTEQIISWAKSATTLRRSICTSSYILQEMEFGLAITWVSLIRSTWLIVASSSLERSVLQLSQRGWFT